MAKKESKAINKKEKNSKDKKSFFKSFKGELKKVSWPTSKQLVNNTVAVIVIVIVIAVIVFVLDLAFDAVNKYGIDKIKESVVTTEENNSENTENTEATENTESTETTENVENSETTEVSE
jgi:preprotein translocase subunit SecE